eukprot:6907959-Alexandrium_andersonii.AAC.1
MRGKNTGQTDGVATGWQLLPVKQAQGATGAKSGQFQRNTASEARSAVFLRTPSSAGAAPPAPRRRA